jgi:site-specific DNA-methyltransferase (adenine-specific)
VDRYKRSGFFTAMDGLKFLNALRDEVADIIFLDPPFNLGKDYGIKSQLETAHPARYEQYMNALLAQSTRVLRTGGALYFYHVPYWASRLSKILQGHLTFRHWVAVSMKNGFVRGERLYPAHYALLYYTKGQPQQFVRPRNPPDACRHCGGLVKDYGGYVDIINSRGINLSDIWDDLSPVRHRSTKLRRANQLPLGLTDRVLDISSTPGMLLVDPFVGSGTSVLSATTHGVSFVANDLARRNVRIAKQRLIAARADD